jgi:hypothetical protein
MLLGESELLDARRFLDKSASGNFKQLQQALVLCQFSFSR